VIRKAIFTPQKLVVVNLGNLRLTIEDAIGILDLALAEIAKDGPDAFGRGMKTGLSAPPMYPSLE
jgi:hypothetical protein